MINITMTTTPLVARASPYIERICLVTATPIRQLEAAIIAEKNISEFNDLAINLAVSTGPVKKAKKRITPIALKAVIAVIDTIDIIR